jgi:hypothetical protein
MSNLITCQVIQGFHSPKKNGKNVIYRDYNIGDKIKGSLVESSSNIDMFKTNDCFLIPKSHLRPLSGGKPRQSNFTQPQENVEYAEVVEDKPKVLTLKNATALKSNMTDILKTKSKTAVNVALVGLVVGLGFAMMKGKSKILFSAIGSVGGFFLGNLYNNYINEEEK